MNSGSHLTVLRRTKIGEYDVKNAIDITLFEEELLKNKNCMKRILLTIAFISFLIHLFTVK